MAICTGGKLYPFSQLDAADRSTPSAAPNSATVVMLRCAITARRRCATLLGSGVSMGNRMAVVTLMVAREMLLPTDR